MLNSNSVNKGIESQFPARFEKYAPVSRENPVQLATAEVEVKSKTLAPPPNIPVPIDSVTGTEIDLTPMEAVERRLRAFRSSEQLYYPDTIAQPETKTEPTTIVEPNTESPILAEPDAVVNKGKSGKESIIKGEGDGDGNTIDDPVGANQHDLVPEYHDYLANGAKIDFSSALALATSNNPAVQIAHAKIAQAYANYELARSKWLPNINLGISATDHEGQLQVARGQVDNIERRSFFTGLGAQASGAGRPRISGISTEIKLADAFLQPQITAFQHAAETKKANATTKDILLKTSLSYLELLNAVQSQAIATDAKKAANELAKLTDTFARLGEGPQSDADRALTELIWRRTEVEKSIERVKVASAELSQNLSLDNIELLVPTENGIVPISLIPEDEDLAELIHVGLHFRDELESSQDLVNAALKQLQRENVANFLPSVGIVGSAGGFGGGLEFTDDFGGRTDIDAMAYWSLRNMGRGDKVARDLARAKVQQAQAEKLQLMDSITREIKSSASKVEMRSRRMKIAEKGIQSASDAYRRDLQRIRNNEGLPIEAQNSLRALYSARRNYVDAIVEYNTAQFELYRAIGWPEQDIGAIEMANVETTTDQQYTNK